MNNVFIVILAFLVLPSAACKTTKTAQSCRETNFFIIAGETPELTNKIENACVSWQVTGIEILTQMQEENRSDFIKMKAGNEKLVSVNLTVFIKMENDISQIKKQLYQLKDVRSVIVQ